MNKMKIENDRCFILEISDGGKPIWREIFPRGQALAVVVPKDFVVGNFESPQRPAKYMGLMEPKKVDLGVIRPK